LLQPLSTLPFLKTGDTICLVSPAFYASEQDILSGIKVLESWGLQVIAAPGIFDRWGSFAGSDEVRMSDLQWALDHPYARAILCIRGGYGISRILPGLNWDKFQENPKWLTGFSDITLLHQKIQQLGFPSLHALMAARYGSPDFAESSRFMREFFFGKKKEISYPVLNHDWRPGNISGLLWGGNLSMVSHSIGSGLESGREDLILFLEEVGEAYYRIDRLLRQIVRVETLMKRVRAVVLGQFTDCAQKEFPEEIPAMAAQAFSGLPVFSGLPSGHGNPNFPLVLGFPAHLKKQGGEWQFSQSLGSDA
jgi:muramoyltetrapeptide carboxypeptidase